MHLAMAHIDELVFITVAQQAQHQLQTIRNWL